MGANILVFTVELQLDGCNSIEDKRSVFNPILDDARTRYRVAAAETGLIDAVDRAELTFCCVSASTGHATSIIDNVERFVWSFPRAEVVASGRTWAALP